MIETQISLTDEEMQELQLLACQLGKKPKELIQEAVLKLIGQFDRDAFLKKRMAASGIWRDRNDIPDLRELRQSMERFQLSDTP